MRAVHGRPVERLLARRCHQHLISRVAEDQVQRAPDLRIVVAHEDPLVRHQPPPSGCSRAPTATGSPAGAGSGNSTTKVVPCPGSDSTLMRPPFSSRNPLVIARPSPEPGC